MQITKFSFALSELASLSNLHGSHVTFDRRRRLGQMKCSYSAGMAQEVERIIGSDEVPSSTLGSSSIKAL